MRVSLPLSWSSSTSSVALSWSSSVKSSYEFRKRVGFGGVTLNFVMLADFSFPRLASTAGLVLGINSWVCAFFANLLFPMMAAAIGLCWVSWIYGICAALGVIFVVMVLPETRGKSFIQIEAEL